MQTSLSDLIVRAHGHICMAHVFECIDSEAACKRERLAWEDAYVVGRCSEEDEAMPGLFEQSRTLTFAWAKARRDRAAIQAE